MFDSIVEKFGPPPEVKAFFWKAGFNKNLTMDHLKSRTLVNPNLCFMCWENGESFDHLFVH